MKNTIIDIIREREEVINGVLYFNEPRLKDFNRQTLIEILEENVRRLEEKEKKERKYYPNDHFYWVLNGRAQFQEEEINYYDSILNELKKQ